MGGTATLRQGTCNAVRPRKESRCATLGCMPRKGEKSVGGDGHASAERVQRRATEKDPIDRCGAWKRATEGRESVVGGTATLRQSTCNAVRPGKIVATLGRVQRTGGRRIVATLGSVRRKGEKSVGGTATRQQSACNAVRPRKENCCDAWKRATEGRAERGREPTATLRHSTSSAVRPRKENCCDAWERETEGEESVVGTATLRQSTFNAVRPRKENRCDAWKRATEGREGRGGDGHASAEHEQGGAAEKGKSL